MSNPIVPIAMLGGGVLLLLSAPSKKRRSKKLSSKKYSDPKGVPSVYRGDAPTEVVSSWEDRQEALKALSGVRVKRKGGGDIPLCSKCDPGGIDGKYGPKTKAAVKAFQAIAGLEITGGWGAAEESAMFHILSAIAQNRPIPCDPSASYPGDLYCESVEGAHGLQGKAFPPPSSDAPQYGPDELLVADPECNYIIHQSDRWFDVQKERVIVYALDGMTDSDAVTEINESMLADYIPLCLTLGRDGVGPGVREFWDANATLIYNQLKAYEALPDFLEEDARELGVL